MLSILITIYNYNLLPLVEDIHQQCLDLGIDFEILTQDDASNSIHNLENEKIKIETGLSDGSLQGDDIIQASKRLPVVLNELEEKEDRWLYLSR